jgi:hypothetical protein
VVGEEAPPAFNPEKSGANGERNRRASQWEGMVSKRGSISGGMGATYPQQQQRRRLPKRRATVRTAHVFSCYKNKSPISPTTQCQLYDLEPRRKQEVQMEYGDDGLYFRREHNWKFKPFGKNEARFDYAVLSNPENNPYQLRHQKSTRDWKSPWVLNLTDQNEALFAQLHLYL